MHTQAGLTLFRDITGEVFDLDLVDHLPRSASCLLHRPSCGPFDAIRPRGRGHPVAAAGPPAEANAQKRELDLDLLAILDANIQGEKLQPSEPSLDRMGRIALAEGKAWSDVFPGVASIDIVTEGTGAKNCVANRKGGHSHQGRS